jgi:hypothetical protein
MKSQVGFQQRIFQRKRNSFTTENSLFWNHAVPFSRGGAAEVSAVAGDITVRHGIRLFLEKPSSVDFHCIFWMHCPIRDSCLELIAHAPLAKTLNRLKLHFQSSVDAKGNTRCFNEDVNVGIGDFKEKAGADRTEPL